MVHNEDFLLSLRLTGEFFSSVLGFAGKYLIQVVTSSWTLLHSFISRTAAHGDKTAGSGKLNWVSENEDRISSLLHMKKLLRVNPALLGGR